MFDAMKLDVSFDPIDIGLFGSDAHMSEPADCSDLVEKLGFCGGVDFALHFCIIYSMWMVSPRIINELR